MHNFADSYFSFVSIAPSELFFFLQYDWPASNATILSMVGKGSHTCFEHSFSSREPLSYVMGCRLLNYHFLAMIIFVGKYIIIKWLIHKHRIVF